MRDYNELMPLFNNIGKVLTQYTTISRKPFDFGVGMDLYPAEIHFLSSIEMLDGGSITELAKKTGVTKGAASQLARKLMDKELICKSKDPQNASRVIITLTSLGQLASKNHRAFHEEHDKDFLEYLTGLDDESLAQVKELVGHMDCWMANYLK